LNAVVNPPGFELSVSSFCHNIQIMWVFTNEALEHFHVRPSLELLGMGLFRWKGNGLDVFRFPIINMYQIWNVAYFAFFFSVHTYCPHDAINQLPDMVSFYPRVLCLDVFEQGARPALTTLQQMCTKQ